MSRHLYQGTAQDGNGRVISTATVTIYLAGGTTAATAYAAASGGSSVGSVTSDSYGSFSFYIDDTEYTPQQKFKIVISKTNYTSQTWDNIEIIPEETYRYYVDPNATDQGAATTRANRSIKDFVDSIGATKNGTLYLTHNGSGNTTTYTVSTAVTIPANITLKVEHGAVLSIGSGIVLTINGPIEAGKYTIFSGSGYPQIGKEQWTRPVEWFGALGDGSTNDYTAFLNALKSCCIQGAGGEILINSQKEYVLENGASPAISLDRDTLPDGTDASAWDDDTAPTIMLTGTAPPASPRSSTIHDYSLKITGTGDGISITGGTKTWRGQLHFKNLALNGTDTADDGLVIDYCNRFCTFENLAIKNFTGNGVEMLSNSTFSLHFMNVRSFYNEGWGWNIDGNAYDFYHCASEYNGGGGVKVTVGANIKWIGGHIQFNTAPQINIADADNVHFDDVYWEGQANANINGSPVTGLGEGIVEITGTSTGVSLSGRVKHGSTTDADKESQFLKFSADVYALTVGPLFSSMEKVGANDTYMIGDIGAYTVQQAVMYNVYFAAGTNAITFYDSDARAAFNLAIDRAGQTFIEGDVRTRVGPARLVDVELLVAGAIEQELTADDATPSVANYTRWKENYTTGTNVTDLDGGTEGQIVIIRGSSGNITLKDVANGGQFYLPSSTDVTLGSQDMITLQCYDAYWMCISYSDN